MPNPYAPHFQMKQDEMQLEKQIYNIIILPNGLRLVLARPEPFIKDVEKIAVQAYFFKFLFFSLSLSLKIL